MIILIPGIAFNLAIILSIFLLESDVMPTKSLKGYRVKNGKVEKINGYGLDAGAKRRQVTSKKVRIKRPGKI